MNKLWQQLAIATNWPVLAAVGGADVAGRASASGPTAAPTGSKQLVFLFVGIARMAAFQAVDYRLIGRFAWGFYLFSLAADPLHRARHRR